MLYTIERGPTERTIFLVRLRGVQILLAKYHVFLIYLIWFFCYNVIMNTVSRIITGIIAILFGLFLIMASFLEDLWVLVYGIPIFIIGIFIFFNKKEDEIEKIKGREN